MCQFSIIIPAYGNDKYLPACLESVVQQDNADWEAIVVNDASPDNTLEIAEAYAAKDPRFKVINKEKNAGLHLARLSGVEASAGDYILFLDADDELYADTLSRLAQCLPPDGVIVHFGSKCIASESVDDIIAASFESWINKDYPVLSRQSLLDAIYSSKNDYGKDWNVDHRLFSNELAKSAFRSMSKERLERAEDGYEMFVLASCSNGEITRNDIVGYKYFMGRGVTNSTQLNLDSFTRTVINTAACSAETCKYAYRSGKDSLIKYAKSFEKKLLFSLSNEWYERVSDDDKPAAAELMAQHFSKIDVAAQIMRFVRDESYKALCSETKISSENLSYFEWKKIAENLANQAGDITDEFLTYSKAANSHITDLKYHSSIQTARNERIRIFVSTHKPVSLFNSTILQPVQVGSALRENRFSWALHDDDGDNISDKNLMYCELTTQYWAWKNVDAEYYGFCHYRRYFDFSDIYHQENAWGEIIDNRINESSQRKYCLEDASIESAIDGYDLVITEIKDLREFPDGAATPYEHYKAAKKLHIKDLDRVISILKEMHPDYAVDADNFINGHYSCFCNMFIMRKPLFEEYCEWLFPILDRFVAETDMSRYSVEAMRTPGHLGERLFNIYINHHKRCGAHWKVKQVQCIHFENTDPTLPLAPLVTNVDTSGIVPVVFAADEGYVPMLTTTIMSMLENANKNRYYDIIVLQRNISGDSQRCMSDFLLKSFNNISLRFYDVSSLIDDYDLTTSNAHISVETYYRFLVQQVLPFYDKVLYLDSDLIVEGDIAELYDTEIGDNLLAATRDVDYLGNLNMPDGKRFKYSKDILGMHDPYQYFQAGVLLLNTAAMREVYTIQQWLEFASEPSYIYNDQDVLNAHCEGRVLYLDQSWNVMHDCGGRIQNVFSYAPADVFNQFLDARGHAKVVHYAGFEKPWNTPGCDKAEVYWKYARLTPYYEALIAKLPSMHNGATASYRALPPKAVSENSPIRKVLDPILPQGSRRREIAKSIGRAVKGI